MATKKTSSTEAKEISTVLNVNIIKIPIEGVSPLIMSRFDEKSKQQIDEIGKADTGLKQGGKKKHIVEPREQYENSIYHLSDGERCGMPAVAFKAAMVTAAYRAYGKAQTVMRSSFHVIADDPDTGLVEIHGQHRMREDMVRVGTINKVAAPRYRAEFPSWSAVLTIRYLEDVITAKDLVGLVNTAGFTCGVGEWRPEKSNSGSFGLFRVVNSD